MKILTIKMNNLASLDGVNTIELESGVLKDAPLFSIVGDTGSGKSTILDAVCLALYGRSPRYNDTSKDSLKYFGEEGEKGKDFCSNTASTKTVNIITKGRKEGYAECLFELAGGVRYRAVWSCKLKNDLSGIATKGVSHTYTKITYKDGRELASETIDMNVKEHTPENVIGLSFEQFTRTMLLAQNQFANFLKAEQKEKARILEAITGTEIYSRTMSKISEYYKEAKRNKDEVMIRLEQTQKTIGETSEETIEEEKKTVTEITNKIKELDKRKEGFVRQQEWWKQYNEHADAVKASQTKYEAAKKEYDAAKEREERLQLYDSVSGMREDFTNRENTKNDLIKLDLKIKREEAEKASEQANLDNISADKETHAKNERLFEESLAQLAPKIEKAKEHETKQIALQQEYKTISNDLADLKKKGTETKTACDSAQKNYNLAEQNLTAFLSKNEGVDFAVSYDFNLLNSRKAELLARQDMLNTLSRLLEEGIELSKKIKEGKAELADAETQKAEQQSAITEMEKALTTAEEDLEARKSFLQTVSCDSAETLRASLKEGQPCPVCGSTAHNINTIKTFTDSILSAKADVDKAQHKRDATKAELEKAKKTLSEIEGRYSQIKGRLASDEEKRNKMRGEWKDTAPQEINSSTTSEEMKAKIEQTKQELQAVESDLKKSNLKNEYDKLSVNTQTQKQLLDNAKQSHKKLAEEYGKKENRSREILEQLNETKSAIISLIGNTTSAETEKKSNSEKEQLSNRRNDIEKRLAQAKTKIDSHSQNLASHNNEKRTKSLELSECQRRITESITLYNAGHAPVNEEMLINLFNSKTNWGAERATIERIKNSLTAAETAYGENLSNYGKMSNEKPEFDLQEIKDALNEAELKKDELENERRQYATHIDTYERNANEMSILKEQYEQAMHDFNNWASLQKCIGTASGDDITMMTQCYTLKFLIREANEQLKLFSKRYTLKQIPNTLGIVVADLVMGGEERHITSISGGETFIVSLALALGLSNLSRKNTKLYNLFIDEGFGSLDAKELTRVIDALETLQFTQKRKVGVISHTSDMRERIRTQIRVHKQGNSGRSSIEVV